MHIPLADKVRKVTERNLGLAILGEALIAFSVGTIFSIKLVKYGYFILIISTFIIVSYINNVFKSQIKDKEVKYTTHVLGFIAGFLLLIILGIQSPHAPFKIYILMIGFILTLPALINIFGGRK